MDKTEQLFIRACRSLNPEKRIQSVYKKIYKYNDFNKKDIIILLSNICDKYVPIKILEFINEVDESNIKWNFIKYNYTDACLSYLITKIRLASWEECFKDCTIPLYFRNKQNKN